MLYKYDIVNALGRVRSAARYLEICTPTTGVRFRFVDPSVFAVRHRLMYRCPDTFDDNAEITFRTTADRSHELIRAIRAVQPADERYDIIFVDPFHSYAASIGDLHGALCLLRPGGVLVAHDCNPTDADMVSGQYQEGGWCGVTYQAFIDFALTLWPAVYCVVDTDYGCGVVFTEGAERPALPLPRPPPGLIFEWVLAREADATRFPFFQRHREALLNLVTVDAFRSAFEAADPVAMSLLEHHPRSALGPDPCLRVCVAGVEVPLDSYDAGWHRYPVSGEPAEALLMSPVFRPCERDPASADHRPLGVAVSGLRVGQPGGMRPIRLSDPSLTEGWHVDEAPAGYPWRWTNGQGRLLLPAETICLEVFTHRDAESPDAVGRA